MKNMSKVLLQCLLVPIYGLAMSVVVYATPDSEVSVEIISDQLGAIFPTGVRPTPSNYVEEEFRVSGSATLFNYLNNPPLGPQDIIPVAEAIPYQTRMIVRRPSQWRRFNGSVVIEWWNSTAGFDTAPVWDASAEYFTRQGYIYVGVSNSQTAINFLQGGCRLLGITPPSCGARYQGLSLPENGLAYEMMSQITNLLNIASETRPIPATYNVERIYHAGQSQQGGSVITYASAFHIPATAGYFIQAAANARDINGGVSCESADAEPFPNCTPRLQGSDALVRTDLPVPVVQATTETDVASLFGTVGRQADAANYRYYEMAGVSHLPAHKDIVFLPAGIIGTEPLLVENLCDLPMTSTADGPVFGGYLLNAMWRNLEDQVRFQIEPPTGNLLVTENDIILRDSFDNALGGIRLPTIDVPRASYLPTNTPSSDLPLLLQGAATLACRLAGQFIPFTEETLTTLYPTQKDYAQAVFTKTLELYDDGFLLPADAIKLLRMELPNQ